MLLAPRHLPRLVAMIRLFSGSGLRDFARQQGLLAVGPQDEEHEAERSDDTTSKAVTFRRRLVAMGPAYVKLGQVLSTRADLLPAEFVRELEQLQDDVPQIPFADVVETIERELGGRMSKLFTRFDETPLGAASLGQVHAAQLRGEREVVVKVQRPGIRGQLADDIEFFRELAGFLVSHTATGERVDFLGVIQELERALVDELDYRVEARNAATFRVALAGFPRIVIPKVIGAFSTERVLTSERIRGVKIGSISPLVRLEHDFRPVAEELTRAYLKGIAIDGHFHADPHPGNVFMVLPDVPNPRTPSEAATAERRAEPRQLDAPFARMEQQAQADAPIIPGGVDVKLALIDFGMTARLSASMRESIVRLLMEISDNRGDAAAATLIEVGTELHSFDRTPYIRDIASLVARNYDLAVGELQAGALLYEVIDISFRHGLKLPAELTLLAKALFNLDAVTRALDETYSPINTIREYGNEIARTRVREELTPRRLLQMATESGELMSALPHRIDVITSRLASNDFATRIEVPQLRVLLDGLQKVANRIFSGLVLAGLLVASAMLLPHRRSLGTTGFVLAAAIAVYLVLVMIVSDRRRD